MNKIPTDIYYNIFTELSFGDIIGLCNSNKRFKNFCLQNQKFIEKIKLKAVKKLLKDDEDKIRDFAYRNKMGFDKMSQNRAINEYTFVSMIDKFTVDLLYLVNNNLLDEVYVLINSRDDIPEPPLFIFTNKITERMPKKIVEMYMKKLPPILELFGYDNEDDFIADFPIKSFTNRHLQIYILDNYKRR
jgi:hypothetical protein